MEDTNKKYYDKFISKLGYDNSFEYRSDIQYENLYKKQLRWMSIPKEGSKQSQCSNYHAVLTHKPKTYDELYEIFDIVSHFPMGVTERKLLYVYGKTVGASKWEEYRNKQATSNTFEYKKIKHNMTLEEFDAFNKSRAVTKDNCISRYGVDIGNKVWSDYCSKQAYTNTREYAISIGRTNEEYDAGNAKKAHTLEVYTERYGSEELARIKLDEFYSKQVCSYSKQSQELFFGLVQHNIFDGKIYYFAEYNNEYGLHDDDNRRYYKYDFVCPDLGIVIEYQGDHYHGNPSIYRPSDFLRGRGVNKLTAAEKWEIDEIKHSRIKIERGYQVILIWESDYLTDKQGTIARIIEYVRNRI